MGAKNLSERNICAKFITPAIKKAGWDVATQIRKEFPLTKGKVIFREKLHTRAKRKHAEGYKPYSRSKPLTIAEFDFEKAWWDGAERTGGTA